LLITSAAFRLAPREGTQIGGAIGIPLEALPRTQIVGPIPLEDPPSRVQHDALPVSLAIDELPPVEGFPVPFDFLALEEGEGE
jgi:hypothetical protein